MTGATGDHTEAKPKSSKLGWSLLVFVLAAVAVFLALRWRELGFHWDEFAVSFRRINPRCMAAAVFFGLMTYIGRALRWQVLLRPVKQNSSLRNLITATVIGFTAIVLFGRAGEPVRPYLIAVKEKVSFSSQIAAWILERIYDLLTALLIFGFALSSVHASGATVGPHLMWVLRTGGYVAGAAGIICLALLIVFGRFTTAASARVLDGLRFLPESAFHRAEKVVTAFSQGMESSKGRNFVYLMGFYSLLEWALIVGCYVCIFSAFPATAGFNLTDVVIFVGFAAFGAVIQLPGVGGGVQVVAIVVLTELFGLPLEASTGVAILLWVTTFVVVVPIGLVLAFHEGLNWRKLRSVKQEIEL